MKRSSRALLAALMLALCAGGFVPRAAHASLSGGYTIGPSGAYPTLTAAFADLTLQGAAGPLLFELAPDYAGAGETYPLVPPPHVMTIRPQAGASGLVLASAATSVFSFGFGATVVVDGRPAGVGTTSQLTLRCTATGAATVQFNDATGDTLRWLTIEGSATSASGGVVTFGVGFFGSRNIVIEHCRVTGSGGTPTNLFYSAAGNVSRNVRGITVQDCELSNWFSDVASTAAFSIQADNYDWTIRRNSIFQTAPRAFTTAGRTQYAILVNGAMPNLVIEDNWIGGSAPHCGGAPWAVTGAGGMTLVSGSSDLVQGASVKRNTIRNLSAQVTGSWRAISLTGPAQIEGNAIGDGTTSGHIAVQATTGQCVALALNTSGGGSLIANRVSNLAVTATTGLFHAIQVTSNGTGPNAVSVRRNLVGGATPAEAVSASGSGLCTGLTLGGSSALGNVADSNTVTRLTHGAASTASTCAGLRVVSGPWSLARNSVTGLVSSALSTAAAGTPALAGIHCVTTISSPLTASHNTVHSLASSAASSATLVAGIVLDVPLDGSAALDANFVHSLTSASADTSSCVTGIRIASAASPGAVTASNNMVRVGIGPAGENAVQGARCIGLDSRGPVTWVGNSVYVGSVPVLTGSLRSSAMSVSTDAFGPVLRNNILANERGGTQSYARHSALSVESLPLPGFSSDANLLWLLPRATGVVVVLAGGTVLPTLSAWQAYGFDTNSLQWFPEFRNALGGAANVDLHIDALTDLMPAAANAGVVWLGWTTDFDGEPRHASHPDIGADEFPDFPGLGVESRAGHVSLAPARPNPSRAGCTFEFQFARGGAARLELFDAGGRSVRLLVTGTLAAGLHSVRWDRVCDDGRRAPPGAYFVRLSGPLGRESRRVIVLD